MKQREGQAQLIATMLDVRSANLMDLSASLPRTAQRIDMRYQWISRLLGNERIETDWVMAPFAAEVLGRVSANEQTTVLIIDQPKANETQQAVVVAVRVDGCSLPIAWRVKETEGTIGFGEQKAALEVALGLLPEDAKVVLMGDRFYPHAQTGEVADVAGHHGQAMAERRRGDQAVPSNIEAQNR